MAKQKSGMSGREIGIGLLGALLSILAPTVYRELSGLLKQATSSQMGVGVRDVNQLVPPGYIWDGGLGLWVKSHGDETSGVWVNLKSAISLIFGPGENHLGSIGGNSTQPSQNPTISTSAYVAGYCVGGVQTLSNALRTGGPSTGVLQSILLVDTSNQKAAMDLIFFNANPASSTLNDHQAATIAAADAGKIIRRMSIAAADWVTDGGVAIVDKTGIGGVVSVASGTTLYMAAITSGTPTYAATALYFREGFLQD